MTNDNSERTISELANAEIVPGQGSPDEWLMRFGDEEYDFVTKTERNKLIVESDLLSDAEDGVYLGVDRDGHSDNAVRFDADLDTETYTISTNGDQITVPARYESEALRALREEDGEALLDVYEQVRAEQVHEDVVNKFVKRYDDERVEVTDEGWVVQDTFLVQWNAENYIVDDMTIHVRDGNDTVAVDDSKQARDLTFNLPETVEADTPMGETVTLGQREQEFLATVEVLLNPYASLDVEQAQTIEDMKEWAEDPISAAASTVRVNAFTDEKTGLHHGHSIDKHRLGDLGVTDEATDHLYYNDFDHAGVVELAYREDQFRNVDFDVFEDASNDDAEMWQKIRNTKDNAPVPDRVHRRLRQMYGDDANSGLSL
jgi:hypothetical protein